MARSRKRSKLAGVVAFVVAAVAVGGVAYALRPQTSDASSAAPAPTTSPSTAVPSAADPVATTSSKPVDPPPADPADVATDTATPDGVSVQITYAENDPDAGGVLVGAYVAGVIEGGGSCALTLTQGDRAVTAKSDGIPDASTTSCGRLFVPSASLASGSWKADVAYSSPGGGVRGSASTTVRVP